MRLLVRILVCLAICLWLILNTLDWRKAVDRYEARFTPGIDLPGAQKPFFFDNDCYYWLCSAERMAANGEWRIRDTKIDNVPYGREMHWSQSIAWIEVGFGKIRALATGEPWLEAIPRAAVWVNPALLAVGLCFLFLALEGFVGVFPALLAVFWILSIGDLAWAFQPYRPDHQSLHLLLALVTVVLFLAGGGGWVSSRPRDDSFRWFRSLAPPGETFARGCFIASGIAGGLSLWVGATLQACCLGLIGVSTLGGIFLLHRDVGAGHRFVPDLFRLWARVGAATSLVMYAVEYLPGHLSMHLEVNHPLYALSWLAAGELMALFFTLVLERRLPASREWLWCGLFLGLGALLPLVFLIGGEQVHAMRNLEVFRLHQFVNESQSYFATVKIGEFFTNYLMLPLCLLLALGLVFLGRLGAADRWTLWIGSVICLGLLSLMTIEERWASYYAQFSVVLMALTLAATWKECGRWRVITVAVAALLAIGSGVLFASRQASLARLKSGEVFDKKIAQRILMKRFAIEMARLVKAGDARLLAEPSLAPSLYYFGHFRSTVTFYWENRGGAVDAAEIFDATDDGKARRIVQERGLTYLLFPKGGNVAEVFHKVRAGESLPADYPSLASRLARGRDVPVWLKRDPGLENLADCVFRDLYRVSYPIEVWEVSVPKADAAP